MEVQIPYWLSVDLSSPRGTLAIHRLLSKDLPELVLSQTITTSGDHSESFIPVLDKTLTENQLSLSQFSKLITSSGPGSFTGLRIAYASLKALALGSRIPIEILSGSEARALRFLREQKSVSWEEIHVVTYITADRFVSAHLKINPDKTVTYLGESSFTDWSFIKVETPTALLLDSRVDKAKIPLSPSLSVCQLDLHAEMLGEALLHSTTKKPCSSVKEWVELTPNYFGSTRY